MSILTAAKPPVREPLIMTICGTPGTGKTSLAATLPGPVFLIQTQGEKVPRDIPRDQVPVSLGETNSPEKLWEQLLALGQDDHGYKTVIIDSVTGLETMFIEDILKSDPKAKAINTALGGYGAGRAAVATQHNRVRNIVEKIRRRGINVVFIAHSDVVRIEPPDSDSFTQYSLRLHEKSMAPYVDSVDVVGFIKQSTVLVGKDDERKRAVTSDDRVLLVHLTPVAVSKNRLGITEPLDLERGKNPFEQWTTPKTRAKAQPVAVEAPAEPETVNEDAN